MSQIIVLGWDGLDVELIDEFGLGGRFGMNQTKIETYNNPVIEKPHTKELWPSMITGSLPETHGIKAVDESDGLEWDNPLLNIAAPLARKVLPQDTIATIGEKLRERGAALDIHRTGYYEENTIETVFDSVGGQAISIPNYQTELDRAHDLDANRDAVWAELNVDRSVSDGIEPQISMSGVYDVLGREVGKRLGQTIQAMHSGAPLVWTWFGLIDSIGHMNPAVTDPLQEHWYHVAASVTQTIQTIAPDDATILAISDHGIQDGVHTEYATLCTDNPDASSEIGSITDVKGWIEDANPGVEPEKNGSIDGEKMEQVNDQLEHLGYV